ncbi:MAG: GNAT family N-acetyltransferase [Erysipelotrichaceae bacterium]|nr:GNAT family N-acetyltransferase [Erysipelotrichaceae bacterium]
MVHIEKLTWDNVDDILKLKVKKEQKRFVASNRDSMIDAYFSMTEDNRKVFTFGIYNDKKPIGFLMIAYDVPWAKEHYGLPENYYIWRFMIDKKHQHKGYGREALKQGIDFIKSFPCGEAEYCWLSYEPNNEVGRKLYISMGFEERMDLYKNGGEIPAIFKL